MSHKMARKIPGVLSREELMAAQLKAKLHKEKFRLKVENEIAEREQGIQTTTTRKIEYRCHYPREQDIDMRLRFEKVEITTTKTIRNGCIKTDTKEKILETTIPS